MKYEVGVVVAAAVEGGGRGRKVPFILTLAPRVLLIGYRAGIATGDPGGPATPAPSIGVATSKFSLLQHCGLKLMMSNN